METETRISEYLQTSELVELGSAEVGASLRKRLGAAVLWVELFSAQNVKETINGRPDDYLAVGVMMQRTGDKITSKKYLRFDDRESWGLDYDQLRMLGGFAMKRPDSYARPQGEFLVPPSVEIPEFELAAA